MGSYKEVTQCIKCKKIYSKGIPYICKKCGAKIGRKPTDIEISFNHYLLGRVILTENAKKVIARKRLFKWEVLEEK